MEQRDEQRLRPVGNSAHRGSSQPVPTRARQEAPVRWMEPSEAVEPSRRDSSPGGRMLVASSIASLVLWTGAVLGVLGGMLGGLRPAPNLVAGLLAASALASLLVLAMPAGPPHR